MKDMNWRDLVIKLLENLLLSQNELAELCQVSQQTVSSWKKGHRTPGLFARKKLLKIVGDSGLKLNIPRSASKKHLTARDASGNDIDLLLDVFYSISDSSKEEVLQVLQRKAAEEDLKKKKTEGSEIISLVPGAIYTSQFDENFNYISGYISPVLKKITGYTASFLYESAAENWQDIIHPEDLGIWRDKIKMIKHSSGSQIESVYRIINASGEPRWIDDIIIYRRIAGKCHIYGIITDVTERKNMEERLINCEREYRFLFENSIVGITVIQDDRIIKANQAAADILGYSTGELENISLRNIICEDDRDIFFKRMCSRLKGHNIPGTYSLRIVDRQGNIKRIEKKAVLTKWRSRPALLGFISEIPPEK
jgi:PAS domain S-box-containing protein